MFHRRERTYEAASVKWVHALLPMSRGGIGGVIRRGRPEREYAQVGQTFALIRGASRCRTTQAPIRDPLVTSISYASGTTQSEEVSVVRATAISRNSSRSVCDAVGAGRHGVLVCSI